MCKGSVTAKKVVDAVVGQEYGVGISTHGLGAFHPIGVKTSECVACVKDGTSVTISGIPSRMRRKFRLGETEAGTFVDNGANVTDFIDFGDRRVINLGEFANRGVTMSLAPAITTSHTAHPIEATVPKMAPDKRDLVAA